MVWSAPFSQSFTWKEILRVLHQPFLHFSSMKHRYSLVMGVHFRYESDLFLHLRCGGGKRVQRGPIGRNCRQNVPQLSSNTCFSPKIGKKKIKK